MLRKISIILCCLVLAACALPADVGLNAYNSGQRDAAFQTWLDAAQAGDAVSQHNLGVVYEAGTTAAGTDYDQAAYWYTAAAQQGLVPSMVRLGQMQLRLGYRDAGISWLSLAARWGNHDAIASLSSAGASIPVADLAYAQQQQQAEAAYQLGCLLAGGCGSANTNAIARDIYLEDRPRNRTDNSPAQDIVCTPGPQISNPWNQAPTYNCR